MKILKTKLTKMAGFAVLALFILGMSGGAHAAGYDFFVDKNSAQAAENGSELYPWKTIGAALTHIQSNSLKKKIVFVKKGTYVESITISNSTRIIGENDAETVIDAAGFHNAVYFSSTKSEIRNFTIKNALRTNVIIDKRSKVTINNCNIVNAGNFGVEVKDSSATDKYKFTMKNSQISESGSQGIYVGKRKISISGNDIIDNDEEGIDLHQSVKGTVSGNNIRRNGESGIEMILSGASLTFKNNKIEDNKAQGLTVQVYSAKKKGKVKITKNTIRNNDNYGVRFANYTHSIGPNKLKIFVEKCVKLSKNTISGNDDGKYRYE